MEISKIKDFQVFSKRKKYVFLLVYDTWCNDIKIKLESFFSNKYDLNKIFLKVCVSKCPTLITKLDITLCPYIFIYYDGEIISKLSCYIDNFDNNLNNMYNYLSPLKV